MINKSFFNEEQKANISIIKHLLEKQNDLQMQIKSLESEIKLLANDI